MGVLQQLTFDWIVVPFMSLLWIASPGLSLSMVDTRGSLGESLSPQNYWRGGASLWVEAGQTPPCLPQETMNGRARIIGGGKRENRGT